MLFESLATPVSGAGSLRAKKMLGCAAAAIAFGAFAPSAFAANECGLAVGGTVTCAPAGNPYATGITYVAVTPITVDAPVDVHVSTKTPATTGISITGTSDTALTGAARVITTGAGSNAVAVNSANGTVSVATGIVRTTGAAATGILANNLGGGVAVDSGTSVITSGAGSDAVVANGTSGTVKVTSGLIRTTGDAASGILATNTGGDVTIDASGTAPANTPASIVTLGAGSNAIVATGTGGNVSVTSGLVRTTGLTAAGITANGVGGNVTVDAMGNVETSGAGSNAIVANGSGGTVAVTTGTVDTVGDAANGITATNTGGDVSVTSGLVRTAGLNAVGITATGTGGNVTITAPSSVVTTGAGSNAIVANGAGGTVSVTSGLVRTNGANANGITANSTLGTTENAFGGVMIDAKDSVVTNGMGSNGVVANGTGGTAMVTTMLVNTSGDAADGIVVTNTGGGATVDAMGDVITSGAGSNAIVVNGTGGTVSVTSGLVRTKGINSAGITAANTGGAVLVNAGTTQASAAGGNAIRATGTGPVTVTSGAARTFDATAIVATSTAGPATVRLVNATVNSGAMDGVAITGNTADLVIDANSSVLGLTNGATLVSTTGSSVSNAGRIRGGNFAIASTGGPATINNSTTGNITGAVSLVGGNSVVNNAGTFDAVGNSVFSAGDRFNNTGRFTVGANSMVPAAVTLTGLPSFNNSGSITMLNGHTGDTLTIPGNYIGREGSQLVLDVAPGTAVSADRLIIGGTATGSTAVTIALPANSQPVFNAGTVIVQAGAGSSANAFGITADTVNAGLVRYDVVYNPATSNYSVVASPSDAALGMVRYNTAANNLWYKSADAVSAHMQSRRDALWSMGGTPPAGKFWVTMAGSVDTVHGARDYGTLGQGHLTNTSYRQDYFGGQLGLDIGAGVGERGGVAFGVTGGYINSRARLNNTADSIAFNALNAGAYLNFTTGNIFFNALGKYDWYWAHANSGAGNFTRDLRGHAYGARGELGLRFGGNSFFIEPLAQISYIKTKLNPFMVQGTGVTFDDRDGLRGKAGARIGGATSLNEDTKMSFYAGANYVHDFKDEGGVVYDNLGGTYRIAGYRMPDYGEAVAGISIASGRSVSGFIEGTYAHTFKDGNNGNGNESLRSVGGRAGITMKF